MGLGQWFRQAASPVEQRALPPGAFLTSAGGGGWSTWALGGQPIDTDRALRHSAVWACVRLLADSVSTLPVHVEAEDGPAGGPLPRPRVLAEPAAGQPLSEWLYSVMSSLLLRGNAYGLITARSGPGLHPEQIELVHPDLVGVTADPNSNLPEYRIGGRPFGRDQVWHVRGFTLPGVLLGLSPIEYARQSIGLGLAAQKFGAEFFGHGRVPSGLLKSANPDLDQAAADAAADRWEQRQRARRVAVLNAATEFVPISVRPDESQFIETLGFNVVEIARVYGVPPEMVGGNPGSSLSYSNAEARALDFVKYSLGPWLVRLESALSRLLPAGQRARFNADALLRGTTTERYTAHQTALAAGWMTRDEVRALEGLPPMPADQPEPAPDPDPGGEQRSVKDLHQYWTAGAGLPRWQTAAQPLVALYVFLARHMTPDQARAAALSWFVEVMGRPPRRDDGDLPGADDPEEKP